MKDHKASTPIADFIEKYSDSGTLRFHMPGHKGKNVIGCESFDITEIAGADVLYGAEGIIAESEDVASELFGTAHTFYSTEGSTLLIKAMLALATAGKKGKKTVLAGRNAHKAFIYGCALLGIEPEWIYSESESICSCKISGNDVRAALEKMPEKPCAVYITSPDYLGNISNIKEISAVCREFDVPLLIDNAHGAYLKFLDEDIHPITLGADMCCDSAHKTLPVLTGGAYLHISKNASQSFKENARSVLSVFASTSPSYLTLLSLDRCNRYLFSDFKEELRKCVCDVEKLKKRLCQKGFVFSGDEKTKMVFDAKSSGYTGFELAGILRKNGCEAEFSDEDFMVLMITPKNTEDELVRLERIFEEITVKNPIKKEKICITQGKRMMPVRDAVLAVGKKIKVRDAVGKICAIPAVSCPPAIPIVISGEIITKDSVSLFEKYGIEEIEIVDE